MCARRRCPAVSCPHPALDGCACGVCDGCNFNGRGCFNGERFPHPTGRCQLCSCLVLSHTLWFTFLIDLIQKHQHLLIFCCTNRLCEGVIVTLSLRVCVPRTVLWCARMCLVQVLPVGVRWPLLESAAPSAQGFVSTRGRSTSLAPPSLRPLIPARHAPVWSVWQLLINDPNLNCMIPPCPFPLLLWSEWGGELSDKTLSSPVLPSGPLRLLLPRLWLLSLWECRPLSRSHLHALLQPLPALYLCQRHRYLCAHGLPANTLPPNCYQARTMLSWVHRYVICEGSDVSTDCWKSKHAQTSARIKTCCHLVISVYARWTGVQRRADMEPEFKPLLHLHLPGLNQPFAFSLHMSSFPCVRVLICLSLTGRRGSVCASRVPQAALYASGDWSRSLLSSLQR